MFGDRIVVMDDDGEMIAHYGVMLRDGLGWAKHSTSKHCRSGIVWASHEIIVENEKWTLVMIPQYYSETGVLHWERYSAESNRVQFDCQSVREVDAAFRDKEKAERWERHARLFQRDAGNMIDAQIIRATFPDMPKHDERPSTAQLAEFILKVGAHPPVDYNAELDKMLVVEMKKFIRRVDHGAPFDF